MTEKMNYARPSDFQTGWIGKNPQEVNPAVSREDIPKLSFDDVAGHNIIIHGYLEMEGKPFKGKAPRPYALMAASFHSSPEQPLTVISSGTVVLKKLRKYGELDAFPVCGRIVKADDKAYYDIIDPDFEGEPGSVPFEEQEVIESEVVSSKKKHKEKKEEGEQDLSF